MRGTTARPVPNLNWMGGNMEDIAMAIIVVGGILLGLGMILRVMRYEIDKNRRE